MNENVRKFGTAPVFFTAISTILGAILFLRFGFAVGTVGFFGVVMIIILGHLVTIPTSLAISEIATNKRVEGGGEYFIISRSFGLNIGATIGIALYLSQSISVAFYIIAFTETFTFLFDYLLQSHNIILFRQAISIPVMIILAILILKKGANLGVKALYFVVAILAISIILFFLGHNPEIHNDEFNLMNAQFRNMDKFYYIFAIIFPAFTGMTAGVGLSGDLKNPSRSIPVGTVSATVLGMIIYFFISYKLANSAIPEELVGDQLIMGKIAILGGIFVPLGLAASTISSALGSIMVAPRTLQALANDNSFPFKSINNWLSAAREKDNEPVNASIITVSIALVFVAFGNVNIVAQIISMFFLITYGSLCLISFLNHFGSSPSYRPSFKSKWIISFIGFITSVWVMFKISVFYSMFAIILMSVLYIYINYVHHYRKGLSSIFTNTIFQINRNLQIFLQKRTLARRSSDWKPSVICISESTFDRDNAFKLTNWISHKYGFGTYLHRIEDYCAKTSFEKAESVLSKLIHNYGDVSQVYIDTIISPSYTSTIAHALQIPSISGMENNMIILEFDKENPEGLDNIIDNFKLINSGEFDVCILASSRKPIIYKNGIHVWIKTTDANNANLIIILSFILLGHPDWKKSDIKIFNICRAEEIDDVRNQMDDLIAKGRLPITSQNIRIMVEKNDTSYKTIINSNSASAGLTIIGFHEDNVKHQKARLFGDYDDLGNILFVHSAKNKIID